MYKNQSGQFVDVEMINAADGSNGTGLTVAVRVKLDGINWVNGMGVTKEGEDGSYEYAPTQAETNADHAVFKFTATGAITQLFNFYPIDVALYKATGFQKADGATAYLRTNQQVDAAGADAITEIVGEAP